MSLQAKVLTFLVTVFFAMTAGIIYLNYSSEKKFVEKVIQDQTHEAVDQYFDSVNTLMISGAMEQREVLRMKALKRDNIVEARIIRSNAVKNLFGEGFPHESAGNEIEKKALEGLAYQGITQEKNRRVLTVITPFKASSDFRGTNCIECHQTPEGTVLGAVKISYSLESLDKQIKENAILTGKIMAGLFLVALIFVAFLMRALVIKPVKKISHALSLIAKNFDLTFRLNDIKSKDEIGEMADSFNIMLEKFHMTMKEINTTCALLTKGSHTIYDLTQKTQNDLLEQQSETNMVASAVTEMNSTAKVVADNASSTQQAIESASMETNSGAAKASLAHEKIDSLAEQVEGVGKEIEKIAKQSEAINTALKMIGEITTRTTMLSFNASIEAARAGVHGQGFSVVAEEIGELATQTRKSTNEITKITHDLQEVIIESVRVMESTRTTAHEGKGFVSESTKSLEMISTEVGRVNSMASSISDAAKEQSVAADSIDNSLQNIMTLTANSVDSANHMKDVGVELNEIAKKMEELVEAFKI